MIPSDLAPGDVKSLDRDWSGMELHRIDSSDDPGFDAAFGALWAEFGARSEVEQPTVFRVAFVAWRQTRRWLRPSLPSDACSSRVESLPLFVITRPSCAAAHEEAIVHLSHNFVAPEWRRTGLAGWLRALPIQSGRTCFAEQQRSWRFTNHSCWRNEVPRSPIHRPSGD